MKFAIVSVVPLLAFAFGCSRPHAFDGWSQAEIVADRLYVFGHRTIGIQKPTYGMSHKSGFEVTQKVFYVFEYDLSTPGDLDKPTAAHVLLREDPRINDSEINYRFRAIGTNQLLVIKGIPYKGACVEKISIPAKSDGRICLSNTEVDPRIVPDFIFNRSGSHFIAHDQGFQLYSSAGMKKEANPLCDVLARTNLANEFANKDIHLSEDLQHLIVFSDKTRVKVFRKDGASTTYTIPIENAKVCDAELSSNRLAWLSDGFTISVGTVGLTNTASTPANFSSVRWDYSKHRVLLVPVTFFTDQQRIETPLTIWNYETGTEQKVRLSSAEFEKQLGGELDKR
jgi:hypothetical protein